MSDCIFCKIVAGQIPATKVLENDDVVAIRDIAPQAPVHILVVPKAHTESLSTLDSDRVAAAMLRGVKAVAEKEGLRSYRTIANTGADSGQTVFHLHLHILGGRKMRGMG